MSEIDWSKPIALYYRSTGAYYADASLIFRDVAGEHPYIIKWTLPAVPTAERVDLSTLCGSLLDRPYVVRNKPVVRRKIIVVAITPSGQVVYLLRDTREGAEKDLRNTLASGMYVAGQVVELKWAEE